MLDINSKQFSIIFIQLCLVTTVHILDMFIIPLIMLKLETNLIFHITCLYAHVKWIAI